MKLTFLGAIDTVTGSKYLIESVDKKILIDCGLFQGYKKLRRRNWQPLPIEAETIDYIILTHAHIDHSGYIPLLVKQGFKGSIYCSYVTKCLCEILLPDSGYLQEEEANRANKYGYTKHKPALPLYTKAEAVESLKYFKTVDFGQQIAIGEELTFTLSRAGHILGASMVLLKDDSTSILFSGDLGRPHDPIMAPPAQIQQADYLVIESTYGNRNHSSESPEDKLQEIITKAVNHGGTVVIPAFAVGRAQLILYYLYQLKSQNKIPDIPIYLDSPMAEAATHVFQKHYKEHQLSKHHAEKICQMVLYIKTIEDSEKLSQSKFPVIIVSASGMACGGRVLHHIKAFGSNHRNVILFTGFQAAGTRGAKILRGDTVVKIHGSYIPINAKIEYLSNLSSHADASELIQWLSHFRQPPREVFITHGEPDAADALRIKTQETYGWNCTIPEFLQSEEL